MSEYKKSCYRCNQEILMSDRNVGKWLPLEADGTLHYCPDVKKAATSKVKKVPLTLDDLDLRLRMVESIVIKGANKK